MSAIGQERPFSPGPPNVRFAPKAVIPGHQLSTVGFGWRGDQTGTPCGVPRPRWHQSYGRSRLGVAGLEATLDFMGGKPLTATWLAISARYAVSR